MSTEKTLSDWQNLADGLDYVNQAFINGQFTDAEDGATFDCISPRDNNRLTRIAACNEKDVELAVQAARTCFTSGHWSRIAARERKQTLLRLADLMEANRDELALLDSLDMGMTITDSVNWNVGGAIECVRWYAELADKRYDEVAPTAPNAVTRIHRVPVGVVAAITPWNYPLLIACWKLAPALAVGNSVVLKPAEQSSLSALKLAQLARQAGLPDGALNVVTGMGDVVGKALGLHMDVNALAFTGSSRVGGLYMQYAGQSNLKRVALECGGKTPNIVLSDISDMEAAAEAVALGAFSNQGQICNAGSRLIIERSIHPQFMELLKQKAQAYQAKDPLDPEARIACLVNTQHACRVSDYIKLGQEQAELVMGNDEVSCYQAPTIFDQVTADMRIAREEIFGPVLSVIPVDNLDEAIEVANSTIYGLGAAVWTDNIRQFEKAASLIEAGVIWNNCHDHGDISSPVGGFKQSGFGRDKSIHAFDKYVEYKTIWINLS